MNKNFYEGKKILLTGHTGFKGSWLSYILLLAGADLMGYSLKPVDSENLFTQLKLHEEMASIYDDIRDLDSLEKAIRNFRPEILIHMAAQPIVQESYRNPVYTYETNVMGTVNLLDCARRSDSLKCIVNVTTDKVYRNREWVWGYREVDELGGLDPYSNSKSCSEMITESFYENFLNMSPIKNH